MAVSRVSIGGRWFCRESLSSRQGRNDLDELLSSPPSSSDESTGVKEGEMERGRN